MKKGTRVRMSEELKAHFRGKCGEAGHHLGPFDHDDYSDGPERDCWGCSTAHVEEFGDCEGIVIGFTDYNNVPPDSATYDRSKVGPEVDVRWQPSNLRYGYHPDQLVIVDGSKKKTP